MVRTIVMTSALGALLAIPVNAAGVTFPAPSGWSTVQVPPSTDATRTFQQWHIAGDIATVTFMRDGSAAYSDALTTIMKNFADNNIKPLTNKDTSCQGKTAHVVEFTTGPEGKKVAINRMLVPDGAKGLITITYARTDGSDFDGEVKKSEATFCSMPPTS